jgi:GT2 family glycosyltransferase
MRISIIMPTFNRCFTLPRAVESIRSQTHKDWELIIVDDGSADETRKVIQPYLSENIRCVKTSHLGTPRAWNLGVNESKQDYALLMGDDVVVEPSCVHTLANAVDAVNKQMLGAVAPRLIYTTDPANPTLGRSFKTYASLQASTGDVAGSFNVEAQALTEVPILHGYSMVRREAFLDIGGFDEKTYSGNYFREETDLWLRFRKKGYRLYYEPRARIYCQKSLTRGGQWSNVHGKLLVYEYYVYRNHNKFLKKFYGGKRLLMLPTFMLRRLHTRLMEIRDSKS